MATTQIKDGYQGGSDNQLKVNSDGSIDVNAATTISGPITVNQGTNPWIVSGTVAATQSGSWTTGRTWTLSNSTDSISSVQSGAWTTGRTWTLSSGTDSVSVSNFPSSFSVTQGTSPWVVSGTVAATQSGTWNINDISGTISLPTGAATELTLSTLNGKIPSGLTVSATRLLVDGSGTVQPVSGTVAVTQSTSPWVTSRNWTLSNSTDSIAAVQSGTWNIATLTTLTSITNPVAVTQSGTWNINNISGTISLPTGAATESTLLTLNGKIPSGLTVSSTRLLVDGSGVVQPVSGTVAVTQSTSPWVTSRNWTLNSGTDSVASVQSGNWSVRLQDGSGNAITSTLINSKQRLDVNSATDGVASSSVPFQVTQVGGKDPSGNLQPVSINENNNLVNSNELTLFASQSKVYSAQSAVINVGTTETPIVLFRNPNASGKTVKIFKVNLSGSGTFRLYYLPTITSNGTTINPLLRKVTSGAQGNVGLTTASPTISVNGSLADTFVVSAQEGTADFYFPSYIILPANTSILITGQMGANNTPTSTGVEWAEL